MRYELFLSLRYLRARRHEVFISLITMISMVGVTIGVMTLNIVLAVMTGFEEDLRDRILGFNPHVVISSLQGFVDGYAEVVDTVSQVPEVVAVAPFVYGQVMVSAGQSVSGSLVRGVDPSLASAVVDIEAHLSFGEVDQLGQKQELTFQTEETVQTVQLSGVLVGHELARQLGVFVGDPINIISPLSTTPGPLGVVPRVKRFMIVGVFDAGMFEYDSALIYMSLADAQQFFTLGEQVTGVEVKIRDVYQAQTVARELEGVLGFPYTTRDWTEVNSNIFAALKLEKVVYFIVLLLIVLVAAFNIIATLIMVVMEKRKDIAVLKSMGATGNAISRIFIYKGLIIGVVGTLMGTLLGWVGCWLLDRYEFIELPKDVFYVSTLPVKMYAENFFIVGVASMIICLLATIYPARQAARLAPVEVIRYE